MATAAAEWLGRGVRLGVHLSWKSPSFGDNGRMRSAQGQIDLSAALHGSRYASAVWEIADCWVFEINARRRTDGKMT